MPGKDAVQDSGNRQVGDSQYEFQFLHQADVAHEKQVENHEQDFRNVDEEQGYAIEKYRGEKRYLTIILHRKRFAHPRVHENERQDHYHGFYQQFHERGSFEEPEAIGGNGVRKKADNGKKNRHAANREKCGENRNDCYIFYLIFKRNCLKLPQRQHSSPFPL
jgi:hypothetical protein